MSKKAVLDLIRWRSANVDAYGNELVCRVVSTLGHLDLESVPKKHRAALLAFCGLPDSIQFQLVSEATGEEFSTSYTRLDVRAQFSLENLEKALRPLGVFVYQDKDKFVFSLAELDCGDLAALDVEESEGQIALRNLDIAQVPE